jgi:hypothetical protein
MRWDNKYIGKHLYHPLLSLRSNRIERARNPLVSDNFGLTETSFTEDGEDHFIILESVVHIGSIS